MRMAAFHLSASPIKSYFHCGQATISFKVTPQSLGTHIQIIAPERVCRDTLRVSSMGGSHTCSTLPTCCPPDLHAPGICIVGMTEDGAGTENVDQLEEAVLGSGHPYLPSGFVTARTVPVLASIKLSRITSKVPLNSNSRTFS